MSERWIKLYEKSKYSDLWRNIKIWRFFEWCLLTATYKQINIIVGHKRVTLEPGQLIFGRKKAALDSGLSEQNVRSCLRTLCNGVNPELTIKVTKAFSIITIVNWHRYQGIEMCDQPTNNQRITNDQPTNNHKQEVIENNNNPKTAYACVGEDTPLTDIECEKIKEEIAFSEKTDREIRPSNTLQDAADKSMISPSLLKTWLLEGFSEEIIAAALIVARKRGKTNGRYIRAIMSDFRDNGIPPPIDHKQANKKTMPADEVEKRLKRLGI